jgi:hypothetical protein
MQEVTMGWTCRMYGKYTRKSSIIFTRILESFENQDRNEVEVKVKDKVVPVLN